MSAPGVWDWFHLKHLKEPGGIHARLWNKYQDRSWIVFKLNAICQRGGPSFLLFFFLPPRSLHLPLDASLLLFPSQRDFEDFFFFTASDGGRGIKREEEKKNHTYHINHASQPENIWCITAIKRLMTEEIFTVMVVKQQKTLVWHKSFKQWGRSGYWSRLYKHGSTCTALFYTVTHLIGPCCHINWLWQKKKINLHVAINSFSPPLMLRLIKKKKLFNPAQLYLKWKKKSARRNKLS